MIAKPFPVRRSDAPIDFGQIDNLPPGTEAFFKVFSRFEFALKESGHVRAVGDGNDAQASWDDFAAKLDDTLGKGVFFDYVRTSGQAPTLLERPPKKQVCHGQSLSFVAPKKHATNSIELFNFVKRVRNNLFHGGKSGDPDADTDDPKRNEKLIAEARWVLEEAIRHHEFVRNAFEGRY